MISKRWSVVLLATLCGCAFSLKSADEKETASSREMKLHYKSPDHEEVNSFERFVRKETRPKHYAESRFDFDESQQIFILNRAFLTKFFDLPKFVVTSATTADTSYLRIASGILDWTVKWQGTKDNLRASGSQLPELLDYIDSTVHASKDYQQLPPRE